MTRQDGRRRKSQRIETFDRIVIFAGRVEIHPVRTHLAGKPGCIAVAQSVRERCDARNNQQAGSHEDMVQFGGHLSFCLGVEQKDIRTTPEHKPYPGEMARLNAISTDFFGGGYMFTPFMPKSPNRAGKASLYMEQRLPGIPVWESHCKIPFLKTLNFLITFSLTKIRDILQKIKKRSDLPTKNFLLDIRHMHRRWGCFSFIYNTVLRNGGNMQYWFGFSRHKVLSDTALSIRVLRR